MGGERKIYKSQSPSNRVTDSYITAHPDLDPDADQSQSPSNRVTDSYEVDPSSSGEELKRVAIPFKSGHRFLPDPIYMELKNAK